MNEKKTFVVRSAAFRWFLDEIVRLNQSFLLILPSTSNAICLQVWLKIKSGANKRWFSISVENVDGSEIFDFILFIRKRSWWNLTVVLLLKALLKSIFKIYAFQKFI